MPTWVKPATKTGADQQASLDKALEAYSKAIALKPENPAYHNNYALTLAKAKKFDEAQAELNKAAQLDPPQAGRYYYNLGAVFVNNGQAAAAEVAFKKSIEANPDYADAQFQYATALSAKLATGADGKVVAPDGMKDALEKYLQLEPTGPIRGRGQGHAADDRRHHPDQLPKPGREERLLPRRSQPTSPAKGS